MRGLKAVIIMAFLIAGSFGAISGYSEEGSIPSRGSFGTHDAGNFTINIGDDGGATGWDTLEFPSGEDRLSSSYFGMGTASDSVDFGDHNEFQTSSDLRISSPGNHTDEEGYCQFSGWSGEDFDAYTITQRTFLNRYEENTRGHSGRWMVIDYMIDGPQITGDHLYFLQTMNIDLGASADDDSFSFLPGINTTAISQGTTFIGLGYFSLSDDSYYFGHNGGSYGPSVYSSESAVWDQMSSPNNQTTSMTGQDWYMDISARIPQADTSGPFHISYIVMVGTDHYDLIEAYHDAVNALRGEWTGPEISGYNTGEVEMEFGYDGPFFPPEGMELTIDTILPTRETVIPQIVPGTMNVTYTVDTSSGIPDHGSADWSITSDPVFGIDVIGDSGSFNVDNNGPDTTLTYVNDDPTGTLIVTTSADDRGGSGVASIEMSMDGDHFVEVSQLEFYDDSKDIDIYARSVDHADNIGPIASLIDLVNDGSPPSIENLKTLPSDLDDKTNRLVTVRFSAFDETSGIDTDSGEIGYIIGTELLQPSEWSPAYLGEGQFSSSLELDLRDHPGEEIEIFARIRDNLGNEMITSISETIDQINDLPEYNISLIDPDAISNEIGILLTGEDLDGDDVTFSFQYSIDHGIWMDFPEEHINFTDEDHVLIKAPMVNFEGDLSITGTVSDGEGSNPLNTVHTIMDRKAPVVSVEGLPATGNWITTPGSFAIEAVDGVSDVFSIWYLEDDGTNIQLRTSSNITFTKDGIFIITVFAQDTIGNIREQNVGTVSVDMSEPIIDNITYTPASLLRDDNLDVEFEVRDTFGFDHTSISMDPSTRLNVEILLGDSTVDANYITPGSVAGKYMAHFQDPFSDSSANSFRIRITAEDDAGNEGVVTTQDVEIHTEVPVVMPFDITLPEIVLPGEGFDITIDHEGDIILEVRYPGTDHSWIISPRRRDGDLRTYELPGCFKEGDILFVVSYKEGSNESFSTSETIHITINGSLDSDGDGLPDSYETKFALDPMIKDDLASDNDDDGLNLSMEMSYLTDPEDPDTDGDGMDDGWEAEWGILPFRDDRDDDPDDDGWSNYREYEEDTDPRDPEDHPEMPVTPWYWILLIVLVLLGIIGYFVFQLFNKKKLEDDLEAIEEEMDWDDDNHKR